VVVFFATLAVLFLVDLQAILVVCVFEAEILGLIVAMEYASSNRWTRLWLESDSSSAVQAFHKPSLIPVCLRNRWHNCTHNGMFIICSHIFREGNVCAEDLAALGHDCMTPRGSPCCLHLWGQIFLGTEMDCRIIDFLRFVVPSFCIYLFPSRVLA